MAKNYIFLDDIKTRKMLFAHLIRSSIPKGTISSISIPVLPKGYFSITGNDIPGLNIISVFSEEMPLFCTETVNYEGEPILAICGPDEDIVQNICNNVIIEYNTDYSFLNFENYNDNQISGVKKFSRGTVESKIKAPNTIIEGEYRTSLQTLPITYPMGAVAKYKNNLLEISTASQWPFHVQKSVSDICGIPKKEIIVNIEPYHHTYDEKLILPSIYSAIAAILAIKSGKQVRIVAEPSQIQQFSIKRPQVKINRKSAINNSGKIIAEDIEIFIDIGAYPLFTDEILSQIILGAVSIYSVTNIRVKATAIRTSFPPMNVFKGCGIGMGAFSAETHFSKIAEYRKMNPVDLRLEYLPKINLKLPTGGILKQIAPRELLIKVSEESDFYRKYSAYELLNKRQNKKLELLRGIGISIGYAGNGFTRKRENREAYSMEVKLDQNNKLYISSSSNGTTPGNIWKETAGRILGLESHSIEIVKGNTTILPNSGPSFLSNDLSIMTNLVERCCMGIKKHRFQKPLPIIEKRSFKSPGKNVWDAKKLKGMPFNALSWGAAIVEVELNPVFLRPVIKGIWTIFDIGRIYDLKAARSAGEAEIHESLNWVSGESKYFYPKMTPNIMEETEKMNLPRISIDFITDSKRSSGGISQIPDTIIPSAYVQAVSQASGSHLSSIPVTPEIIFKNLEKL
ncbi:MAG: xanthine dehydrogenase family protein [Spirochaetia bacterium]|jgi:CO/xanthine dehydrogenase Mo-binding subunit|nr:xanthine dehydrogenase family protein [Spirochaetia bacterium]